MSAPFDPAQPEHVALYDELPLWSAQAGALLLDHVPLTAQRALDLGCGAGFPLLELAERLGPGSHVTGVDPWAQALGRAARKIAAWPVPQAALVRGDGAALPFRSGSFELITSNLGVNNFAHPEQAHLQRLGRLVGTCWIGTARRQDAASAMKIASNLGRVTTRKAE